MAKNKQMKNSCSKDFNNLQCDDALSSLSLHWSCGLYQMIWFQKNVIDEFGNVSTCTYYDREAIVVHVGLESRRSLIEIKKCT
jgi:hypothetical protein